MNTDDVRVRYLHYRLRTEQAYGFWVRAHVRFNGGHTHARDLDGAAVEAFLSWLASERKVAAWPGRFDHAVRQHRAPYRAVPS